MGNDVAYLVLSSSLPAVAIIVCACVCPCVCRSEALVRIQIQVLNMILNAIIYSFLNPRHISGVIHHVCQLFFPSI